MVHKFRVTRRGAELDTRDSPARRTSIARVIYAPLNTRRSIRIAVNSSSAAANALRCDSELSRPLEWVSRSSEWREKRLAFKTHLRNGGERRREYIIRERSGSGAETEEEATLIRRQ
jgi:hypothetical protein